MEVFLLLEGPWNLKKTLLLRGRIYFGRTLLSSCLVQILFLSWTIFILEVIIATTSLFTDSLFSAIDFSSRGCHCWINHFLASATTFATAMPTIMTAIFRFYSHSTAAQVICTYLKIPVPLPTCQFSLLLSGYCNHGVTLLSLSLSADRTHFCSRCHLLITRLFSLSLKIHLSEP